MTSVTWIAADWPAPTGIVAGTTLRTGGVSQKSYTSLNLGAHVGDDERCVQLNRSRFVRDCELPVEPAWLSQVHGTTVVRAGKPGDARGADAIIANSGRQVCAVLTADCLPVLFSSDDGREIAAAHAGWRGLCDGVLEATVSALESPPFRLIVWFGPAISQPAFEVGTEVRDLFVAADAGASGCFEKNARGRWQADLYGLAAMRLRNVGVTRLYGGGRCTFGEPDAFFSYRRDGQCGRMATFVFRTG